MTDKTCRADDCTRPVAGQGLCLRHHSQWLRAGKITLLPKSDGYRAVHTRLARKRGPAREHDCIIAGCYVGAAVWAWQRTGPSRTGPYGNRGYDVTWGTDIADYAPMCLSHAAILDHGGTLTHCPNGHDRETAGTGSKNNCLQCKREADAARKRSSEPAFCPPLAPGEDDTCTHTPPCPHISSEALWDVARRVDVRSAKHTEDQR